MWIGRYYVERWTLVAGAVAFVAICAGAFFLLKGSGAPEAPAFSPPANSLPSVTSDAPAGPSSSGPVSPTEQPASPTALPPLPASASPSTAASVTSPTGQVSPAATPPVSPTASASASAPGAPAAPQPSTSNVPKPTSTTTDYAVQIPEDGDLNQRTFTLATRIYDTAKKLAATQWRQVPGQPIATDVAAIASSVQDPNYKWDAAGQRIFLTNGTATASIYICVTGVSQSACPTA